MRKITKFPKLVIDEAKNLKKFATPDELSRLNFSNLHPEHGDSCIYGQMTGDCHTPRATELIEKCTKRVYHQNSSGDTVGSANKLNGSPKKIARGQYWSPIEVFISRVKSQGVVIMNAKLIAFLKGERKRLI